MGKAFVAKLAKEGARDPEALAAWIGRKKHGASFGKKQGAEKKSGDGKKEAPSKGKTRAASKKPPPAAAQGADNSSRNGAGFTEQEEQTLTAASSQARRMDLGQLLTHRHKSGERTREDELRAEAASRELERRKTEAQQRMAPAMESIRKLTSGSKSGSFMMGTSAEGVSSQRLRRMSDEDLARNLQLARAVGEVDATAIGAMSSRDKTMLYDVMRALHREQRNRQR
ncbi:hypothetical protein ABT024_06880 [Streptomyces sp. NPDC002812]|uniref:hypothetical protein n=1 Tax=Streptomyces sp. NPDC002812 TaxID=3154434 RepID=UPI00332C9296